MVGRKLCNDHMVRSPPPIGVRLRGRLAKINGHTEMTFMGASFLRQWVGMTKVYALTRRSLAHARGYTK